MRIETWKHAGWITKRLCWVVLGLGLAGQPLFSAEEAESLAGTYRDDQVVIELGSLAHAGNRTTYTGTIQMGERTFPLKAEAVEGRLTGTFESEGAQFGFEGSVAGRTLAFTTDGTTYRLTKQPVNPLARPTTRPNPLATTPTNSAPSISRIPETPAKASSRLLQFRRFSVLDRATMIGGEAFSLLIPVDWQIEGGLAWRMYPAAPAFTAVRMFNSDRSELIEAFPAIPFIWIDGGIPLFPPGSNYLGYEVGEPVGDPATYITQILVPRFRPGLNGVHIAGTEEIPALAEAIGQGASDSSVQKKVRAARVRLGYSENGRAMEEDIYCVLVSIHVPATRTTYWGPDRNYSFRAEKGQLDARTRVFQTVVSSYRPNFQWFNRYLQLLQIISQIQLDATRPVAELSRFVAQTTDEITEGRRQTYERQQSAEDRINAKYCQYLRGFEEFRSPFDRRPVQLPAGFSQVWTNPIGDYLLSSDAQFNPNSGSTNIWRKVERSSR